MTLYRRVAIENGESAEPVQFVGVYPLNWPGYIGEPEAAFVEEETDIEAKLTAADALAEALGAIYAYEYEEIDLPTWKKRFPNIAWTRRAIKLAAQSALRQYREAGNG